MTTPNQEEIAYMLEHANDTWRPQTIACCTICAALSLSFVILRLVSRRMTTRLLHVSDILIVIAFVFAFVYYVCFSLSTSYGAGRHIIFVTDVRILQILFMVNEIVYGWSIAFIKYSILALYGSIFPQRVFRSCLWAVAALITAWLLASTFVCIFHCVPIAYLWDPTITDGHCLDDGKAATAFGIINIITDIIILTMPIPLVMQLNLRKQKKILIIIMFALGGSACIISITRLPYTINLGSSWDATWDSMPAGINSAVELMSGILVTSIPTYLPLFHHMSNQPVASDKLSGDTPGYVSRNPYLKNEVSAGSRKTQQSRAQKGITVARDIELATHIKKNDAWIRVYDNDQEPIARLSPVGYANGSERSLDAGR